MLLNESGIRLPKNMKSAKICVHEDMDGFFSGLLLYHQLIRQGVRPESINIKFVQYNQNDLLDKVTKKNPYQAILSGDFAAYPKIDMETSYNGFAKAFDKENNKNIYPPSNASYKTFKKYVLDYNKEKPSRKKLVDFLEKRMPEALLFTKSKDSTVRRYYEDFMKGWSFYTGDDNVELARTDYTSDHHSNDKGDLTPGKAGQIGRTQFKSDTEHIATVAAQNLMNWEDIEVITRIDSATYKDLQDVLVMKTSILSSQNKKERLGNMTACLVGQIIKNNPRLAEQLIKMSQPSLISVYNNALKIVKINDNEIEILREINKDKPDWKKIDKLRETLPGAEKRKILVKSEENDKLYNKKRDTGKSIAPFSAVQNKNIKNIERESVYSKTDFKFYGNVAFFKSTNIFDQPGRYLFAYLEHEGKLPAFSMRDFTNGNLAMIQVSCSPLLKEEDKKKIDLQEICLKALDTALDKGIINKIQYEVIKKKSGGHKSIYQLSNIDIIKNTTLSPQEKFDEKYYRDYEDRRKVLNKVAKKELDKGYKKNLDVFKAKKNATYTDAVEFFKTFIIQELNSRFGDIRPPKQNFTVKMREEE